MNMQINLNIPDEKIQRGLKLLHTLACIGCFALLWYFHGLLESIWIPVQLVVYGVIPVVALGFELLLLTRWPKLQRHFGWIIAGLLLLLLAQSVYLTYCTVDPFWSNPIFRSVVSANIIQKTIMLTFLLLGGIGLRFHSQKPTP